MNLKKKLSKQLLKQELQAWRKRALRAEYKLMQLAAIPSDSPAWKEFKEFKARQLLSEFLVDTDDAEK